MHRCVRQIVCEAEILAGCVQENAALDADLAAPAIRRHRAIAEHDPDKALPRRIVEQLMRVGVDHDDATALPLVAIRGKAQRRRRLPEASDEVVAAAVDPDRLLVHSRETLNSTMV